MKAFLPLCLAVFCTVFVYSALGEVSEVTMLSSPLMMLPEAKQEKGQQELITPYDKVRDSRLLRMTESSSGLEERTNLNNKGIPEDPDRQTTQESKEASINQDITMVDRFMAVIGNPIGTFFGKNQQKDAQERALALKGWHQQMLSKAFNDKIQKGDYESNSQKADLLIQLKNNFHEAEISKRDLIAHLLEIAAAKGRLIADEFIYKMFDESLENLQQGDTSLDTSAPLSFVNKNDSTQQAQELIEAAKKSPIFSEIFRPKRLSWCLGWALSRNYSKAILDQIRVLANQDLQAFASREEEKNQYGILYRKQGVAALEEEFFKLLEKQSDQLLDAALSDSQKIADLLMTVRLQFNRNVTVEEANNIDLQLLSLAEAQGSIVKDAFYDKMFDQSLNNIQITQYHRLSRDRELPPVELAEQLIQAVKQSSLITTIPVEQRLSYCKEWARNRLANEEVLNCIYNQW